MFWVRGEVIVNPGGEKGQRTVTSHRSSLSEGTVPSLHTQIPMSDNHLWLSRSTFSRLTIKLTGSSLISDPVRASPAIPSKFFWHQEYSLPSNLNRKSSSGAGWVVLLKAKLCAAASRRPPHFDAQGDCLCLDVHRWQKVDWNETYCPLLTQGY